jgi:hypothetical protein
MELVARRGRDNIKHSYDDRRGFRGFNMSGRSTLAAKHEGSRARAHTTVLGLLTLLTSVGSAQGQAPERYYLEEWKDATHTVAVLREVSAGDFFNVEPADASFNFDNWTGPSDGGHSLPFTRLRVGEDEIGDDLNLVGNTGGRLTASGESLGNMSADGTMSEWTATHRWYDSNLQLLGEFTHRSVLQPGIPPGVYGRTRQSDGFWDFLDLSLPDRIRASVQYSDPLGIDPHDFAMSLYSPLTLGSSSSYYRNFTTAQDIDTGDSQVNLAWFIRTTVVPTPSTILVALTALPCVTRRRRSA